jgi:adenylate kinase
MRFLQKEFSKRLAETVSGASEYHLLIDGKTLYLETSPQQIIDILKNSRQPVLAICLSDTVRRINAILHSVKKSSGSARGAPRTPGRQKAS